MTGVEKLIVSISLGRQEIEQQAAELTTVNEISDLASTQLNLDDLVTAVGNRLQETFDAESTYIALFDAESETITFPYIKGREEGYITVEPKSLQKDW